MGLRPCQVVWIGDSITAGNHVNPGECYPELVAAQLPSIVSNNIAVPSAFLTGSTQVQAAQNLYDASKLNICCLMFGANDGQSTNSTGFIATQSAACSSLHTTGFKVVVLSMLPCGSYASSGFREGINALDRTTSTMYDVLVDVGHSTSVMGIESAKNDSTLYSDGVHPTAAGNLLLEPYITPVIRALAKFPSAGFGRRF